MPKQTNTKTRNKFQIGDLVWVKYSTFPHWPARIYNEEVGIEAGIRRSHGDRNKPYLVFYYGSDKSSCFNFVSESQLSTFRCEGFEKFTNPTKIVKNMRFDFSKAFEEASQDEERKLRGENISIEGTVAPKKKRKRAPNPQTEDQKYEDLIQLAKARAKAETEKTEKAEKVKAQTTKKTTSRASQKVAITASQANDIITLLVKSRHDSRTLLHYLRKLDTHIAPAPEVLLSSKLNHVLKGIAKLSMDQKVRRLASKICDKYCNLLLRHMDLVQEYHKQQNDEKETLKNESEDIEKDSPDIEKDSSQQNIKDESSLQKSPMHIEKG